MNPKTHPSAEVDLRIGDPTKASNHLGQASTTTLEHLC